MNWRTPLITISLLLLHQSSLEPQSHLQTHPKKRKSTSSGICRGGSGGEVKCWMSKAWAGCHIWFPQPAGFDEVANSLPTWGVLWWQNLPHSSSRTGQAELKMLLMFYILIEMGFTWGTHLSKSLNRTLRTCASHCVNRIPGHEWQDICSHHLSLYCYWTLIWIC